jgi:excisionase family DNA binding protein
MSFDEQLASLVESAVSRALAAWAPPMPDSVPARKDGPRLLTVAAAAEFLAISEASVRRLIERGELPAVKAFSSIRLDSRDLDAWIDRSKGAK